MLRNIYRPTAPKNGLARIRVELIRYEQLSSARWRVQHPIINVSDVAMKNARVLWASRKLEIIGMHCQVSFAALERQSAIAACLLSLIAFLNFDDIFQVLFE
jgi:hypothetical protein